VVLSGLAGTVGCKATGGADLELDLSAAATAATLTTASGELGDHLVRRLMTGFKRLDIHCYEAKLVSGKLELHLKVAKKAATPPVTKVCPAHVQWRVLASWLAVLTIGSTILLVYYSY
jgi:hypothetical protein